ncbi:MAG: cyclophilin family peptidyl-prolyl cis-trans isomerase/HEAT repeat protein [Planctomycetota bacterium]|jgi:cyclophilin family peptidyl-prolyl cis-trans isomerase/HEAT repeat protein
MQKSSESRFTSRLAAIAPGPTKLVAPRRWTLNALIMASLFAIACSTGGSLPLDGDRSKHVGPIANGSPIEVSTAPDIIEIRELEAQRSLGEGKLVAHLTSSPDANVRARAARALGRLPFPEFSTEVTGPLCVALEDEQASVRAAASIALGMRADPESAGVLLAYWRDSDPTVRANIIRAASQVDTPPVRSQVLRSMNDPDMTVQIAAIRSTVNWSMEDSDAADVDRALLDSLSPTADREIIWNVLFALQRRNSERGRGAFIQYAGSTDERTRIFAMRGLSRIIPSAEGTQLLMKGIADEDWRVACEAAYGLGESNHAFAIDPLLTAVDHDSTHVRVRALEALRNFKAEQSVEIVTTAWRGHSDLSGSVRSAALGTLARMLNAADAVEMLDEASRDRDPVVRMGAALGTETLEMHRALPLLQKLVEDKNLLVATTAIDALKHHPGPQTRAMLHAALASSDNGKRLSAILALAHNENAVPSDTPLISQAIETATGDIAPEVVFNGLRCLGKIGGEDARRAVIKALEYPNFFVRRVARTVLSTDFGQPDTLTGSPSNLPSSTAKVVGRDYTARTRNPMANVITSRGTMTFELFATEAPAHVERFIELARAKHYDGLSFHRVVPNFVIQGGDYRGDGNGGVSKAGASQGQEFNTLSYIRGSLGMPRNENPDSGGAQIFVTHRDTPHLDERYTLFGLMTEGGEVLDAIEVGDVIVTVLIAE